MTCERCGGGCAHTWANGQHLCDACAGYGMSADREVWTLFIGNGVWSHAVQGRDDTHTLCGRRISRVREWTAPGNDPGCHRCYAKRATDRA